MMNNLFTSVFATSVLAFALLYYTRHEASCATAVTKCLTAQSCECDLINCACCQRCSTCLDPAYSECCSCMGTCPKPNATITDVSSKQSNIEDLPESIMILFDALVAEPDAEQRWEPLTFLIRFDAEVFKPNSKSKVELLQKNYTSHVSSTKDVITLNCSVVYMNNCMLRNKCKKICMSMGARSYRWFHDGCCECVGDRCMNYGINESRCKNCTKTAVVTTTSKVDYSDEKDDKRKDGQ